MNIASLVMLAGVVACVVSLVLLFQEHTGPPKTVRFVLVSLALLAPVPALLMLAMAGGDHLRPVFGCLAMALYAGIHLGSVLRNPPRPRWARMLGHVTFGGTAAASLVALTAVAGTAATAW